MKFLSVLLAALLWTVAAHAQNCSVPNTFINGTIIDAGQVNANFAAVTNCATSAAHVATKASLNATPSTAFPNGVWRDSFFSTIPIQPLWYTNTGAVCSLNGGSGDGGYQVPSSDGKCWVASLPASGVSPMEWGTHGDGSTDDTVALQAASNGAAAANVPLVFDTVHLYSITSTITIATPMRWVGPFRYGNWVVNQPSNTQPQVCPWGVVNKSGTAFNLVTATALTGTIAGVCFDATGNNSTQAASGAVIKLAPPSLTTYSAGWLIQQNTILNPFDGITLDGAGAQSGCCGKGAAADPINIEENTINNPLDWAITVGRNQANGATSALTIRDNAIICGTHSQTRGGGILLTDGSITVDETQAGPVGCTVGLAIKPGTVSGFGQSVNGNFKGQLGSASTTNDIQIKPTALGSVALANFESQTFVGFVGTPSTGTYTPILIDCSGLGASPFGCQEIAFSGLEAVGPNGASAIMSIIGGTLGPFNLSIVGSDFCQSGNAAGGGSAISINTSAGGASGHFVINGNRIGIGCSGSPSPNGITLSVASGAGFMNITGNDLSTPTTPISYTPNAGDRVITSNNLGIDDTVGSLITAAATISLPSSQSSAGLTGTTTITTINGAWSNRKFTLIPLSATPFGTGGNICGALTAVPQIPVLLQYNVGESCWLVK